MAANIKSANAIRAAASRAFDAAHFARPHAWVPPGADTVRRAASTTDQVMTHWRPPQTAAERDSPWEHRTIVDRTRDLVANDGHAQAAVDLKVGMVVGNAIRYSARHELMAQRLGITVEQAFALASEIETAWSSWSNDKLARCDWEQELRFGPLTALTERHKQVDGEALAILRWEEDDALLPPGWKWRTSLQVIDPDRLSNPLGKPDSATMFSGIETDGRRVVAYHFRDRHPADRYAFGAAQNWTRVEARTPWGRPVVLHLRDKTRAGQKRGISKFCAVLRKFKMLQRFTDSEIQAAAVNAMFGGFIKTTSGDGEEGAMLGIAEIKKRNEIAGPYYKDTDPRLSDGTRIPRLLPGDEFELFTAQRYKESFAAFVSAILYGIAAGLGVSGAQLTMDFSKTNFSSWRGEMLVVWRGIMQDRETITSQFCDPVLLAVIEEGIDLGLINPPAGCPDLYENTDGWLSGRWIGPGRGTIDPSGEVAASVARIAAGLSTHEDEALEITGNDYEAIAGQLAYERELWEGKGLMPSALREMTGADNPPAPAPPGGGDGSGLNAEQKATANPAPDAPTGNEPAPADPAQPSEE